VNAVLTKKLTMNYSRKAALDKCTLTIPRGSVAALVGPNGAGKTTLLEILTGLIQASSGSVQLLDEFLPGSRGALRRVAFVAQNSKLYPSLSVDSLIRLASAMNPFFDGGLAKSRLRTLGVPLERRLGKLSGGQQAQVALTLAIARRPELLILDEPLSNLDPLARQEFLGLLMEQVATSGTTVIFSSHSLVELERVADYLILIVDGHIQIAGSLEEIIAHHRVVMCAPSELDGQDDVEVIHRRLGVRFGGHLVRIRSGDALSKFNGRSAALEEISLGYLRRAEDIRLLEEVGTQ
jgi:ABC-2 type transport system ATP-binding protein